MIVTIARRFLNLLFAFGVYNKHFKIVYDGDITSANKIWAGGHWGARSAMKNKYRKIFSELLVDAKTKPMNDVSLIVFFNTRHDVCNLSSITKVLMDTVKGQYIPDDNTKHFKASLVAHDSNLAKGTVEFHLIGK